VPDIQQKSNKGFGAYTYINYVGSNEHQNCPVWDCEIVGKQGVPDARIYYTSIVDRRRPFHCSAKFFCDTLSDHFVRCSSGMEDIKAGTRRL